MGNPRTFEIDEAFDDLDSELRHTEMMLKAYPATAALAVPFSEQRLEAGKHKATEASLQDDILLARAMGLASDDELNRLVDATKNAVLAAYDNDYQAPLYKQLFAGQSPSALKRPQLGTQLATMRNWVGPLGAAESAELADLAPRVSAAVVAADDAESKMALAQQAMDVFVAGARTKCVNDCNALRKLTYGKLAEMAHSDPQLPNDFPNRFFVANGGSRAPTIAELTQTVERTRAKLKRQEAQLEAMSEQAAQELRAQQEAELAERKAKLDAAQKRAAEAAAEVAKLQAEMDGG